MQCGRAVRLLAAAPLWVGAGLKVSLLGLPVRTHNYSMRLTEAWPCATEVCQGSARLCVACMGLARKNAGAMARARVLSGVQGRGLV